MFSDDEADGVIYTRTPPAGIPVGGVDLGGRLCYDQGKSGSCEVKPVKINIDFGHPYFDEKTIFALAEFYIDRALEWDETPEYRQWKKIIDKGN